MVARKKLAATIKDFKTMPLNQPTQLVKAELSKTDLLACKTGFKEASVQLTLPIPLIMLTLE
jgi:hypothetical protein